MREKALLTWKNASRRRQQFDQEEGSLKVHRTRSVRRPTVTTDGENLVSHAGAGLLSELADRSGLTEALSVAMGDCGISWHTHDPGVVLSHLAVSIADGADCLSDLAVLRNQEDVFGPVASQATAWRALEAVTSLELAGMASAAAKARATVWAAASTKLDALTVDFDATLVTSHSDKQDAAPTYKRGYGFHPFGVWLDETGEPLAAMLRPGNAGANCGADHVSLLGQAIDALPEQYRAGHQPGDDASLVAHPILARADSAGASHDFVDALGERNIGFSIGYQVDGRVRDALLLTPEEDWTKATNGDGAGRHGAWVAELSELVDLSAWPEGTRLICRRERPHPGAQLSLFDMAEGWRHTCFITDTAGGDLAGLERRHRGHARVEDRIRNWKDCGLANLPFEDYVRNQAWVATSLLAGCLLAWAQHTCLDGVLARAEPKTLRYRLLHVGARMAHRGGQLIMRIDRRWPWRHELEAAYRRLRVVLA